ncbi:MAG TPA: PEGA domain-containing protein [Polyangiaceae bacterium]|nr:PEGA domain-containing protein [Polyangiaceae bacterium]
MTRFRSLLLRAVACAALVTAGATAAPVSPVVRLKARNLYAAGEKALDAGDVDTAGRDFDEAYRTLPNAAVLLKIAECKSRQSDAQGAVEALEHYLRDKPSAPDRAKIEARVAELRNTPGIVTVVTTPGAASIWVDGADSQKVSPSDIELSPGEHTIAVQLPRYETIQQTLTVEFASRKKLELTLAAPVAPAIEPGTATTGSVPTPPESTETAGHRFTPAFWVAVGGTVVGAGVMTGFGVAALDKHSDYQKKPTRALYDDGRRDAVIADVALGVTAVSAVTAAVLFFTSKKSDGHDERAVLVTPSFERGGAGITGYVRF